MYDVTDKKSFENVQQWLVEIDRYATEGVQKLLIGNKSDMENRAIEAEQARAFAAERGIPFIETSAKNAENVEQAFQEMAKRLKEAVPTQKPVSKPGVDLRSSGNGSCC